MFPPLHRIIMSLMCRHNTETLLENNKILIIRISIKIYPATKNKKNKNKIKSHNCAN